MIDINKLTVKERIELLTGETAWTTKRIAEKGIPDVRFADGPNGVRKEKEKSTCFPSASLLACSFNEDLLYAVGQAIGYECRDKNVDILLGPSVNIKRAPLCGRNFEYYSEDPYLTGTLASAYVKGVQSQGVGACVKHFAANNQESFRMTVNCVISERVLHEIYFKAFEMIVKSSQPYAIMTSYNRLNGQYVSENAQLLTDLLRNRWRFDGITISDWGAVNDRVKALKAGLDLEMPYSPLGIKRVEKALADGKVSERVININAERVINTAIKCSHKPTKIPVDVKSVAIKAVAESVVLLKNENKILPLNCENIKIAVVGRNAVEPAIQGGGCAKNEILWTTDFITELQRLSKDCTIRHFYGCEDSDFIKAADAVIFFIGEEESSESEGYDRENLEFPREETETLTEICALNPYVITIMQNGSAINTIPLLRSKAIVESYYAGSGWGAALALILTGKITPSGKLAETFPLRLKDNPAFLNFPGNGNDVLYSEGLFVGYRYYTANDTAVSYPFGFGLSYTEFEITDITLSQNQISENGNLCVDYTLCNVGKYDGAEVVQIYIGLNKAGIGSPLYELKKFQKTFVNSGEKIRIRQTLYSSDFESYDVKIKDFILQNGDYTVNVATSCVNIVKSFTVRVKSIKKQKINRNTRIGELLTFPYGENLVNRYLLGYLYMAIYGNFNTEKKIIGGKTDDKFFDAIMQNMPIRALCNFSGGKFTEKMLKSFVKTFNSQND